MVKGGYRSKEAKEGRKRLYKELDRPKGKPILAVIIPIPRRSKSKRVKA